MSEVFISYASDDRPRAKALAEVLAQSGFSVWWDRKIPTGEAFDEELEKQLDQARAVVVLWSPRSVKSKWVKDEAAEGLTKKALFPVMIEDVRLPFGYRRIQTADFKQWEAGQPHLGFDQLVASLRRAFRGQGGDLQLDTDHPAPPPVRHNWFIDRWRRSIAFRIGLLALPALVMALGAVAMMNIRVSTQVQLDLTVRKLKFTVAGANRTPALDSLAFSSLYVERFTRVSLSPKWVRLGDRLLNDVPRELRLEGSDPALNPSIQFRGAQQPDAAIGKLDMLMLKSDTAVTLERARGRLQVSVDGQPLAPAALVSGPLQVRTLHVNANAPILSGDQSFTLETRDTSPEIQLESAPDGMTFKIGVVGKETLALLPKGGTLIKAVDLLDMSTEGQWVSTLMADGSLSYPNYPSVTPVTIGKSDFVGLAQLARFSIVQLELDPRREGLALRMGGKVDQVTLRRGEFSKDARLTVLDLYRGSANAVFLVTLVLGLISGTWSLYMAVREARA